MLFAILGDIHFGVNEEYPAFVDYHINLYKEAIQEIKKEKIKEVFFLGDFVDDRRSVSWKVLNMLSSNDLIDPDLNYTMIAGNHDCYYKNTNKLNALRELFGNKPNVRIIDNEPETLHFDGKEFLFIPFMNKENYDSCLTAIRESTADFCFGHFDISGATMMQGIESKSNLKPTDFSHFKHVFSGHFHLSQKINNIYYVGSIGQFDWGDHAKLKRFLFLASNGDIGQRILSAIIFDKININNEFTFPKDLSVWNNKFLKIYINRKMTKTEEKNLEDVINGAIRYEIVDNTMLLEQVETEIIEEEFADITKEFLDTYVDIDEDIRAEALGLILTAHNSILNAE